jgi:CxxC-x17-CxxC domain-containing protein
MRPVEKISVGDLTRHCRQCGESFMFSEGEQAFYLERGYQPPAYCPNCRDARRAFASEADVMPRYSHKQMFDATCSECGTPTQVPFQPNPGRPVYCQACFARKRAAR